MRPPMNGCSGSGTFTLPSSFWKFSKIAMIILGTAHAVALLSLHTPDAHEPQLSGHEARVWPGLLTHSPLLAQPVMPPAPPHNKSHGQKIVVCMQHMC